MGNNLAHELNADDLTNYTQNLEADDAKQNVSSSKRKTSASVDEIRNLFSALQELVPSQTYPPSTAGCGSIPEEASTSRSRRKQGDKLAYDVGSRSSDTSLGISFTKRYRCSSPLPRRSRSKIVQRNRSNSCIALSDSCLSLSPRSAEDLLSAKKQRKDIASSTDSQRITEELSNIIENFETEKPSLIQDKNYLGTDSSGAGFSSGRRHSVGDILGQSRERLQDPKTRSRRKSIGGSLLLNTLIESRSNKEDSLANALSIIEHKDKLQEILQNCQINSEEENTKDDGIGESFSESFDEIDGGKPQQQPKETSAKIDTLVSLMNEPQKVSGRLSDAEEEGSDADKTPARVGAEMHSLLEALQDLVVSGDATPALTPPPSRQNSRRTSWVEKSSPMLREPLNELEAFFKNKLHEISKKESHGLTVCKSDPVQMSEGTTRTSQNKNNEHIMASENNHFQRSSSAEQYPGSFKKGMFSSLKSSSINRSQSTINKIRPSGTRRASMQIEGNRPNQGKPHSFFERTPLLETSSIKKNKVTSKSNASSSRSRRRKSDIPFIGQTEVFLDSTAVEEEKRALWKEDQQMFAKQVNQRLEDWLERATALSLSKTNTHATYDDRTVEVSGGTNHEGTNHEGTNHEGTKKEDVKTKRIKFAMKKAFKGRIKRSKSLHNLLDSDEIPVEKPKLKSPLIERSKKNLRKLGRLRIPRSKSMLHVAELKPQFDNIETKSTESDESYGSSSTNTRRSVIWYDDDSESPELIPKVICGENLDIDILSKRPRRMSCPAAKEPSKNVNSSTPLDSKRISRLPVHLPLFYLPRTDTSNLRRTQIKVENCPSEKEDKMPQVCKELFPVNKENKNKLFYEENNVATQLSPNPLLPPKVTTSLTTLSSSLTPTDDAHFMMFQNYDMAKLSASPDFVNFNDFRDRAKSTESEDSGCPNTND